VVDRSLTAANNMVVLAVLDGEFTIKRYRVAGARVWLEAANQAYPPLLITEGMTFEVWGCIKHVIRML
jgi:DNA polymerase V